MSTPTPREAAFISLLHAIPEDEIAQCQLITGLMLSMWQLSGSAFSLSPPSFLLVNDGGTMNPLMNALVKLTWTQMESALVKPTPDPNLPAHHLTMFTGNPESARKTMRAALAARRTIGGRFSDRAELLNKLGDWPLLWRQAKAELFPVSVVNHYHSACDKDFGLVSGLDDQISLLIGGKHSRDALRKDLDAKPGRLDAPSGFSNELEAVTKRVVLMGTFPAAEWDSRAVDGLMGLRAPIFFLPHPHREAIAIKALPTLQPLIGLFNLLHRKQPEGHIGDPLAVPVSRDLEQYEDLIGRLSLDLPGDRSFIHRVLVRQASSLVYRIAMAVDPGSVGSPVVQAIAADLYRTFLRGISYGVASLKYHAYGLGLGSHRPWAVDSLEEIRKRGEISRRDLQRKVYTMTAGFRDLLLPRLEEAGLIVTEGKMIRPVTLSDFLRTIPARERFPQHSLLTTCFREAA